MDSYFIISIFKPTERKGIVEVLCVSRVDGECQYISEVTTSLKVLSCNLLRYPVGRIRHFRLKAVWKGILGKDRMHFGVVLARLSEHVDNMSARGHLASWPVVNDRSDLHSRTHLQLLTSVSILSELVHPMDGILVVSQRLEVSGIILLLMR